jgi:glutamine amidotransferase
VLPGVGAFADGTANLRREGWDGAIADYVGMGRPFLGVCLGMQLLFDSSTEGAPSEAEPVPGLSVLPGRVVRFREDRPGAGAPRIKVPHMGWNALAWDREDPLLAGVQRGDHVYFVHGYYVDCRDAGDALSATADYAGPFCATVWRDNVWATQFHPEKSQRVGLQILRNFAALAPAAVA